MDTPENERFRDSIATIDDEGKRNWIYPRKPSGRLYNWRQLVSYGLLAFLLIAPFIKANGNQFLMFNVLERRFNIFGVRFWPQDYYIFFIIMVIGIVFIVLFTAAFGRIFCGWMCPQTIFMEMVFRRIEYWIEGDRGKQIRLDRQKWNAEKIRKKGIKWTVFALISFVIANVFLAYLVGSDTLLRYIKEGPMDNLATFGSLVIFTAVFYFVFAWFREQVCVIACPYGRLQSVLLDEKSIVVAYDYQRGEREKGRAKFRKNQNREELGIGDCIDCFQCVQVCPTGIDIRNGTQLECVNCTACIDACDAMMKAVDLPKGLIRFASEENIAKKKKFKFTPRLKGYTAVLVILIGVLIGTLSLRSDVEATILRLPGELYQRVDDYTISNVYTYKLFNKTTKEFNDISFKLKSPQGVVKQVKNGTIALPAQERVEGTMFLEINETVLTGDKTKVIIEVYSGEDRVDTQKVTFMGPRSFRR